MTLPYQIRMCLAGSFAMSFGIVTIGILEPLNTPLSKTTCFTGYTDCGNEKRQHDYPLIPYILTGIISLVILYVILSYTKTFNKPEVIE